jgi:iron complex outermembrane receptor protein
MFRANIFVPGTNNLVSGFDPEEVFLDGNNEQDLDSMGASLRMRWDLGRLSLHSVTGYETVDAFSQGDIDGGFGAVFAPPSGPGVIPFSSESADGMPDHSQLTQEFRWESNEWGAFDWQAGVYYFDEDITIDSFSYDTLAGSVENGSAVQDQDNQSWAVFGSVEYELSDALTLRGGLRYTEDEKDFSAQRFQSPVAFLGATPVGPFSLSVSDEEVTGDVSATWSINDGANLFARVARGYRAPSIQGRILFSASNDPDDLITVADSETILSWEAGVKADVFGDRGRVSFTVYKYTIDDQQLTAVGGTTNFNRLFNANETDGQGFELDLEAIVTDNLLVTFGASYNDTEINDSNASTAPCGGGCTVLDPPSSTPGEVSLDGNRLPQSPEWIANMTARWGMPVGNGEFFVFTDWAYRSDINFFLYESAEFEGTSLLEGGLRIGYNWNDGRQQLALFGRNITDEIEAVGGIDFNNLTGFINEPRRIGLEFSTRF